MNYFVLFVLNDLEKLEPVLKAWELAGVSGVTVMASTGLGRISVKGALREDVPLIPSLNDLLEEAHEEMLNRTMFSIVSGDEIVERILAGTESVLGSLDNPHTGILAVMPLARVYGLKKPFKDSGV